jgi:hypothetical protein
MPGKKNTTNKKKMLEALRATCWFLAQHGWTLRKIAPVVGVAAPSTVKLNADTWDKAYDALEDAHKTAPRESGADEFPLLPPSNSPIADIVSYHERCYYLALACYRGVPTKDNATALSAVVTSWANARRTLDRAVSTDTGEALKVRYAKEFDFSECENDRDRLGDLAREFESADASKP